MSESLISFGNSTMTQKIIHEKEFGNTSIEKCMHKVSTNLKQNWGGGEIQHLLLPIHHQELQALSLTFQGFHL